MGCPTLQKCSPVCYDRTEEGTSHSRSSTWGSRSGREYTHTYGHRGASADRTAVPVQSKEPIPGYCGSKYHYSFWHCWNGEGRTPSYSCPVIPAFTIGQASLNLVAEVPRYASTEGTDDGTHAKCPPGCPETRSLNLGSKQSMNHLPANLDLCFIIRHRVYRIEG